jgi:hypothetical protein
MLRVLTSTGRLLCGIECAWRAPPGAIGDNVGARVGGLVSPAFVGAGVPDTAHAQTRAARVPQPDQTAATLSPEHGRVRLCTRCSAGRNAPVTHACVRYPAQPRARRAANPSTVAHIAHRAARDGLHTDQRGSSAPPSSSAISAVAAANVGRGGLCSAVWRIPEYRLSGVALSGTHGVLHDIMTYSVL